MPREFAINSVNGVNSKEKPFTTSNTTIPAKERFNDPDLSLSLMAKEVGYNPKYLSHFFKEKMNVGYSEYLRSLRLKYAISLFEHGLNSIKTVAYLSGFSDPLYFSSSFKKVIGLSPKEFIISLTKNHES